MTTAGERQRKPALSTHARGRRPGMISPFPKTRGGIKRYKKPISEVGVSERVRAKIAEMGNRRSAPAAGEGLAERQKKLVASLVAKRRPRV